MEKIADLKKDLQKWLLLGREFADYMNFWHEEPGFYMFMKEINSARNWVARIDDLSDSELLEKMPLMVELLASCARAAKEYGYEFLALDFGNFGKSIDRLFASELEAVEEQRMQLAWVG